MTQCNVRSVGAEAWGFPAAILLCLVPDLFGATHYKVSVLKHRSVSRKPARKVRSETGAVISDE